jgi:hypothetical protein
MDTQFHNGFGCGYGLGGYTHTQTQYPIFLGVIVWKHVDMQF